MPPHHDTGLSKIRIIFGYILTILPSAMLIFSGVMKLIKGDFMVESMGQIDLIPAMQLIGVIEILCVVLYWIPKTSSLGFYLLCSYFGGIIAAELIANGGIGLPVPGVPLAVFFYVGTFLRRKELSGLNL